MAAALVMAGLVGAEGRRPAAVYAEGPPPGHTGGFDEPTCQACHFDQPANAAGGRLAVEGVPERYRPNADYPITIVLTRAGMGRGGFQLAARYLDGDQIGRQAGMWQRPPSGVQIVFADDSLVQYVEHTQLGTELSARDTVRWEVSWRAPPGNAAVTFHVAANAANDDASEFGDYIYLEQLVTAGRE